MAESEGSVMQKILSLTAPPHSSPTPKLRGKRTRSHVSHSSGVSGANGRGFGVDNHSYCDACGDGGDLLCCERCPASFHFGCCDPPMSPSNLPDGEWLCHTCRPSPTKLEESSGLFRPLLLQAYSENPQQFFLPDDIRRMTTIPESIKLAQFHKTDKTTSGNGGDSAGNGTPTKYCHFCDGSSCTGQMVSCNFCPLSFHLDCLDPPLTNPPLGSSWMCPNHAEHAVPNLHHSRLTKRLAALERCRTDMSHHVIKMDFISRLKEIPHYKRLSTRTNRRTSEVPPAIKGLYAEPTEDSKHIPGLVGVLLSAAEHVEWMRREMEEERKRVEVHQSAPPTHDVDEWTRHKVVSHIASNSSSTSISTSPLRITHNQSTLADLSDILGPDVVQNHLSQSGDNERDSDHTLNGLTKPQHDDDKQKEEEGIPEKKLEPSSLSTTKKDETEQLMDVSMELCRQTATKNDTSLNLPLNMATSAGCVPEQHSTKEQQPLFAYPVPDISQLDDDMIKMLAIQRLRQLFTTSKSKTEAVQAAAPSSSSVVLPYKNLNGLRPDPPHQQKQVNSFQISRRTKSDSPRALGSSRAVLCPLSYVGPVYPIHKCVVTIGTGSDTDVCLKDYGYCKYVSLHHACLLLDQVTDEYELVNYSEHGSIVDGVLYSCDFSDKAAANSEAAAVLMLDDLTARGDGIRAERAKRRLEAARRNLRDKEKAKQAINAALSLSRSLSKDCVLDSASLSGSKRSSDSLTVPSSPPPSSVVSIPLAKARKNSPSHKTPDRAGRSRGDQRDGTLSSPPHRTCVCKRSASSVLGSDGKGWEGAANIYHGSRLRFGCIQLVMSVAGRPGHTELLHALRESDLT